MNLILIDFISKQCKATQHDECSKRWNGLSFEVICNCNCHKKNNEKNIVLAGRGKSSSTNDCLLQPNEEVIKYDY